MAKQKYFIPMKNIIPLKILGLVAVLTIVFLIKEIDPQPKTTFRSEFSMRALAALEENGPRVPGSNSHFLAREFITNQLLSNGWDTYIQTGIMMGHPIYNIIASRKYTENPIILGSHYDSRMFADRDPFQNLQSNPVPGANDGGSSTAILLELSRVLPIQNSTDIILVFFDAEDQGNIPAWDWILGSRYFVAHLDYVPSKMVLLDMVGGFDQKIEPPANSNVEIYTEIQNIASNLGYENYFANPAKHGILDDHAPFLEAGIPAVDLIDIQDARWHTTEDDIENVSTRSLQRVGDTVLTWILANNSK